ncbi:MAG: hypothetical protein AB1Z98_06445 [Nannocystaceae bacterium]
MRPDIDRLAGLHFRPDPDEAPGETVTVERGQWLRHRLTPYDASSLGLVPGALLLVGSATGIWLVRDWSLSGWFSAVLCLPLAVSIYVVLSALRRAMIARRMPPALIELGDHPLRADDECELLITQPGATEAMEVSARLRCRRIVLTKRSGAAGTQGSATVESSVMFEQPIPGLEPSLEDYGVVARGRLRIPPNAPSSGTDRHRDDPGMTTELSWWIDVTVAPNGHAPVETSALLRIVPGPFG